MALYFLKEVVFCALLAAAMLALMGVSALGWKAAGKVAGGVRYARTRLAEGCVLEVFLPRQRQGLLRPPARLLRNCAVPRAGTTV